MFQFKKKNIKKEKKIVSSILLINLLGSEVMTM